MFVSVALYFVVATALSACWLWIVPKLFGITVRFVDLFLIAALGSAIAPLPRAGWALAPIMVALLLVRTTEADGWREAALMVVGSSLIWLVVQALVFGSSLAG